MSAPRGGRGISQKQTAADGGGGEGQPNVDVLVEKKKDFHLFIITWKYFLFNINVMFEYSVLYKHYNTSA